MEVLARPRWRRRRAHERATGVEANPKAGASSPTSEETVKEDLAEPARTSAKELDPTKTAKVIAGQVAQAVKDKFSGGASETSNDAESAGPVP